MEISGKRAVVTGGGSGLGRALCLALARQGAALAIADINLERAEETLAQVNSHKPGGALPSFAVFCDVGSEQGFEKLKAAVETQWAGLDILINNAGVAAAGRVEDISEEDWQWMLNINLQGVIRGCRAFVPMLRSQGSGHVVNIASFAGLGCPPGMASYNVAKAGVIALSESLRGELLSAGVGVSVACPSFFTTQLMDTFRAPPALADTVRKVMARSPVQADDVGRDIIQAIVKNKFMVISHSDARRAYLVKRLMPERFFKMIVHRWANLTG